MSIWQKLNEVLMGKPPSTYPEKVADQIGSKLDHLAQNPKGLQVKELVARLRPRIEAAQESGYTLEDIVGVFKSEGVTITLNTLKQYLREIRSHSSDSDKSKPPASDPKPKKESKTETLPKVSSSRSKAEETKPDTESEDKPRATNTDERGVQRMRSDDEL